MDERRLADRLYEGPIKSPERSKHAVEHSRVLYTVYAVYRHTDALYDCSYPRDVEGVPQKTFLQESQGDGVERSRERK
jgi:hypothetical protein